MFNDWTNPSFKVGCQEKKNSSTMERSIYIISNFRYSVTFGCVKMHYIILGKYTEEGIKNMKDSPKRLEAAQKVAKSVEGEIKQFYLTMGRYDFVSVIEAPSNEAVMKALLTIASAGAIKTETLVALPIEEYKELLKGLP